MDTETPEELSLTTQLVNVATGSLVLAIGIRNYRRSRPTGLGKVLIIVSLTETAYGTYRTVRELLQRPEVQERLLIAKYAVRVGVAKVRAKLSRNSTPSIDEDEYDAELLAGLIERRAEAFVLTEKEQAEVGALVQFIRDNPSDFMEIIRQDPSALGLLLDGAGMPTDETLSGPPEHPEPCVGLEPDGYRAVGKES